MECHTVSSILYTYVTCCLRAVAFQETVFVQEHADIIGCPIVLPRVLEHDNKTICHRMALVCGTSTCHMAVSQSKLFIYGVWEPFWSDISLFELLNNKLRTIIDDIKAPFLDALTQDVHVLPNFHGNRSPAAAPKTKGIICGMTLDISDRQLAVLYLATVQGMAYGTHYINFYIACTCSCIWFFVLELNITF
ncbi:FGGY carbohydrate kinase domain-containing protein-like isoform X4 [Ricinus communis]|uniref:FGGY carbohydrate kinase domain-containing protein-like isoform X4 n=1 Tax=Ricinus communis TaxID=3988 RepID=UPI00201ACFB8|nr:FGGY carbohydrate kinase domain-containing protein-like isoform X4 [Ricinus communis]XP_048230494.1 FGGY carbohydrate kinase domain-containing protein-like isoform X4 [Ricinus communis]